MRYVVAYAGNTWEVLAIRVWFVPFLAFSADLNGHSAGGWPPSVLAGVSAIVAVPVSIAVAELALRLGRDQVVCMVSLASVSICLMLGWLAAPMRWFLPFSSCTAPPATAMPAPSMAALLRRPHQRTRAAALTLFGLIGFTSGFLGPLAVGLALKGAGGVTEASAWFWGLQ